MCNSQVFPTMNHPMILELGLLALKLSLSLFFLQEYLCKYLYLVQLYIPPLCSILIE